MDTFDLLPDPASTTSKVAGPLTRPEPGLEALKLTRILVPTDFSEPARKTMRYAERMAAQFGAAVTLLHVFEPPTYIQNLPEYPIIYVMKDDHPIK